MSITGYLVWAALADARGQCAAVEATERGEANSNRGSREFYYPTTEAVMRTANAALRAAKLVLVLASVGAVTQGVEGAEVPLTFRLFHAESGEAVDFAWTWPLADAREFVGRHAARAATLSSAEKHFQLHLLAIEITGRDAASAAAKAAGDLPAWATATAPTSPRPTTDVRIKPHVPGPPPHAREHFDAWAKAEFRRKYASDPLAEAPSWDELVAMLHGGHPRECGTKGEEEHVCRYLATYLAACGTERRAS